MLISRLRNGVRCSWRLIILTAHIIIGAILIVAYRVAQGRCWYRKRQGQAAIQWWLRRSCRILALKLNVTGNVEKSPAMLVSNHISWLDIIAIGACLPSLFIAKDDVSQWPGIGYLATHSGTLFIRRRNAAALNEIIAATSKEIKAGQTVAFFPEGTSTDGLAVKPFHNALYQAAVNTGCPVQPVALRYIRGNKPDTIAPFIGNDYFVLHLLRLLMQPSTQAELTFMTPVSALDVNRRRLAQLTRDQIVQCVTNADAAEPSHPDAKA